MNEKREMRDSTVSVENVNNQRVDPCNKSKIMRSRIEEFEFQKMRGWLDSKMAANYLGISLGTLYNLKDKGFVKSDGNRKLVFRINELDRYLKGK